MEEIRKIATYHELIGAITTKLSTIPPIYGLELKPKVGQDIVCNSNYIIPESCDAIYRIIEQMYVILDNNDYGRKLILSVHEENDISINRAKIIAKILGPSNVDIVQRKVTGIITHESLTFDIDIGPISMFIDPKKAVIMTEEIKFGVMSRMINMTDIIPKKTIVSVKCSHNRNATTVTFRGRITIFRALKTCPNMKQYAGRLTVDKEAVGEEVVRDTSSDGKLLTPDEIAKLIGIRVRALRKEKICALRKELNAKNYNYDMK